MHFAASLTGEGNPLTAAKAVVQEVSDRLDGRPCELAVLFVSSRYRAEWGPILREIRHTLGDPLILGCTAGGVLGVDRELESTPALSLVAAHLPRVELHPFTVSPADLEEAHGLGFWIEKLGATPAQAPVGILLPDPFTCDVMTLVPALNAAYPKMPLIGGLASGAQQASGNALFLNDQIVAGAVGVLLTGDVTLQTIVAQGCRPIGRPYVITKAQDHLILELAGMPATEALRQLFLTLPPQDQALAQRALFLGLVMNEQQDTFRRGDFLIRNLMGIDPEAGALAIGDRVQVGQTVQFQLRDADASRDDLRSLLTEQAQPLRRPPAAGALLFSCLGRGRDLYAEPHVDIRTIQAAIGQRPLAGFFCNGEIGPVGGRNFVHGFTASLGLFRPRASLDESKKVK